MYIAPEALHGYQKNIADISLVVPLMLDQTMVQWICTPDLVYMLE